MTRIAVEITLKVHSASDQCCLRFFTDYYSNCKDLHWSTTSAYYVVHTRFLWLHKILILSVQNIRNTFLILSCTPFYPENSLNSSGHGLYMVSKAFHRDAGACWLQRFPQLCQIGWMSVGWWTILDQHWLLLSVKNPAALRFFTHSKRCAWHLLLYHARSNALQYFVLPIYPLNGTRLGRQGSLVVGVLD